MFPLDHFETRCIVPYVYYTTFSSIFNGLRRFQVLFLELCEAFRLIQPEELRPLLHHFQFIRIQRGTGTGQQSTAAVAVLGRVTEIVGLHGLFTMGLKGLVHFPDLVIQLPVGIAGLAVKDG